LAISALAVYVKDVRIELRSRYAAGVILMFAISTLAVVSFSIGQSGLEPKLLAALFWIVLLFSAMAGLARVFVREEESGTALLLRLKASPGAVFVGKLLFNLTLLIAMTAVITPLFFVLTDATSQKPYWFAVILVLGVMGLCSATTLIGAMVAKAAVKGALFTVLSFPILIVLLLMLVSATAKLLGDNSADSSVATEIQGLIAYCVVMTTASVMLFRFVWKE
jgi:heme exporter protein B